MSAFERLPWSVGHPLCPTQEMSAKGAPVTAERARPQPDCCEGFRQAVAGGRGLEAGGAACPPCTGRRVLSPSSAAFTWLPTHLQVRLQGGLREGTEGGGVPRRQLPQSLVSHSSGQQGDLFIPPMATRRRCPKDYIPLHSVKQASQGSPKRQPENRMEAGLSTKN